VRLDVFLKTSRLVKRRTVAKEACDKGRIGLNGRPAKAGAEVRPGDLVSLDYGPRVVTVRVVGVPPGPVPRAAAGSLYELVSDVRRDPSVPDPEGV